MGGNATKKYGTSRIPRDHNKQIRNMVRDIDECLPTFTFEGTSYGDIDVVCTEAGMERAIAAFDIDTVVSNGSTHSAVLNWCGNKYQIDFIVVPQYLLNYTRCWYSYSNMSILIGKVIPFKFKFAHDGLKLRDSNHRITTSFEAALEFLGFSYSQFMKGFNTREEMLDWIATSKYFNHAGIIADKRNAASRRITNSRPYMEYDTEYLLSSFQLGLMPKSKLNKFYHIERRYIKQKKTLEMAYNRMKNLCRRYLLSYQEEIQLRENVMNHPDKWVVEVLPVQYNFKQCLLKQHQIIKTLSASRNMKFVGKTKVEMAMQVQKLLNSGYTQKFLIDAGVTPVFLKGTL